MLCPTVEIEIGGLCEFTWMRMPFPQVDTRALGVFPHSPDNGLSRLNLTGETAPRSVIRRGWPGDVVDNYIFASCEYPTQQDPARFNRSRIALSTALHPLERLITDSKPAAARSQPGYTAHRQLPQRQLDSLRISSLCVCPGSNKCTRFDKLTPRPRASVELPNQLRSSVDVLSSPVRDSSASLAA